MTKRQKAEIVYSLLNQLFPSPSIPLTHSSPFTLLIAVLLSAQCTDARVNQITPILFQKANTPEKMLQLSISEIEEIIQPCGLYKNKAKAIWNLSKLILENFQGQVPEDLKSLETLPGVGHKTASVVLIQAFSKPAFPVDTHIHRCAKRWGLSSGKSVEKTEEDLKKLFPKEFWGTVHLQIIYYARKFCPARGHIVEKCPICTALKKTIKREMSKTSNIAPSNSSNILPAQSFRERREQEDLRSMGLGEFAISVISSTSSKSSESKDRPKLTVSNPKPLTNSHYQRLAQEIQKNNNRKGMEIPNPQSTQSIRKKKNF